MLPASARMGVDHPYKRHDPRGHNKMVQDTRPNMMRAQTTEPMSYAHPNTHSHHHNPHSHPHPHQGYQEIFDDVRSVASDRTDISDPMSAVQVTPLSSQSAIELQRHNSMAHFHREQAQQAMDTAARVVRDAGDSDDGSSASGVAGGVHSPTDYQHPIGHPLTTSASEPQLPQLHDVKRTKYVQILPTTSEHELPRKPKQIQISTKIVRIGTVLQAEQVFFADFIIVCEWDYVDGEDWHWSPHLSIRNAAELDTVFDTYNIKVGPHRVRRTMRYRGRLYENLELHDFPFDQQELTIVVRSGRDESEVTLHQHTSRRNTMDEFLMTEFSLLRYITAEEMRTLPSQSASEKIYSELHVHMYVERNYHFYAVNIAAILFLIVSTGLVSFGLAVDNLADRMQIMLTLVLTSVAFKFVVSDALPKVSYLTILDKYVLGCFIFQYVIIAEIVIAYELSQSHDEAATTFDKIALWVLSIIWVVSHFYTLFYIIRIYSQRKIALMKLIDEQRDQLLSSRNVLELLATHTDTSQMIHNPAIAHAQAKAEAITESRAQGGGDHVMIESDPTTTTESSNATATAANMTVNANTINSTRSSISSHHPSTLYRAVTLPATLPDTHHHHRGHAASLSTKRHKQKMNAADELVLKALKDQISLHGYGSVKYHGKGNGQRRRIQHAEASPSNRRIIHLVD